MKNYFFSWVRFECFDCIFEDFRTTEDGNIAIKYDKLGVTLSDHRDICNMLISHFGKENNIDDLTDVDADYMINNIYRVTGRTISDKGKPMFTRFYIAIYDLDEFELVL